MMFYLSNFICLSLNPEMLKYCFIILCTLSCFFATAQVCSGNFGNNIFESGDFGEGTSQIVRFDPNLAPGYNYTTNLPPADGFYTVVNSLNSSQIYPDWLPIGDNSGNSIGYMMVINASYEPGLFYEQTISGLCDNVLYEFSADIINLIASFSVDRIDPNVSFLLDDQVVFTTGNVPKNEKWNTYGFTFSTAPGQTTLKLSLRNNAPGGIGNDLALDNITFRPCGAVARILPETIANICEDGEPIDIFATVEGAELEDVFVQWQQSFDGGASWENLADERGQNYTFSSLSAGDYYYRYLLADSREKLNNPKCRTISNTKIVRVIPKFVSVIDSLCTGLSATVGASSYSSSGIYIDTLQNVIGCDSIVTLDLTFIENDLQGTFFINDPTCIGFADGTITIESLTSRGPYSFKFDDQKINHSGNIQNLEEGEYQYHITDRYGCEVDTILTLTDPPAFLVDLGPDQRLFLGEWLEISEFVSEQASSYQWNPETIDCEPPCESISILLTDSTKISLIATSIDGCVAQDEVLISIDGELNLLIPNIFTPNNDGLNDFFTIFNDGEFNAIAMIEELSIYDRSGRKMFSKESFQAGVLQLGWDGKRNGVEASTGVYFYAAKVQFINGEKVVYTGDVSLLR